VEHQEINLYNTYLIFSLVFFLSLIFIYVIRLFAPKIGLMDIPNERSVHASHTPIGAGIGFFLSSILVLSLFYSDFLYDFVWVNTAIWIVFIIGVYDDYFDSTPYLKFFVFIVATLFLSFDGLLIENLGHYFATEFSLGWMALPFTIFAVVGYTNATNLIDGLDGLAATLSIIVLSTFYIIGYQNNDLFIMLFAGSFIAGLLAFLTYNWNPASIFMGDSGSLTLGFVISMLAVKSLAYIPAISIFFIGAIPIMDTLIVMIRRKIRGKSMFTGDRCHLHHLLKFVLKGSTTKTVLTLGLTQILYSGAGLYFGNRIDDGYLLMFFILNIILLYGILEKIIKRQRRDC
jgi:UDP-GlcNAc:undecaprenyl-phosphate GlcNAc-1-phosphate transferase